MAEAVQYPRTTGNVPSRHAERAHYDAGTVHAILDEGLVGHVAFVADGRPTVLPMLYVRRGEAVYLHGSTGAHLNRMAVREEGGIPVCFEVTLFDALVLARAVFSHSVNYRSVVIAGAATVVVEQDEKRELLDALVERLVPGRTADARQPTDMELRQTAVLELPLGDVSAKVRTGDPLDAGDDLGRPCWAGTLPLVTGWGEPRPSADLAPGMEVPGYLRSLLAGRSAG